MFYADDGMVVSPDPAWLQGAFSALVAIFDRVGLRTNVNNTVSMACHPCRAGSGNTMVARAGGYYGEAFKGARGVTQGDPISPTIFNVVVDVVVRHWIEGLVTETAEKGETGR